MGDRSRAKISGIKEEDVEKARSQTQEERKSPPAALCHVDESSISAMTPGDILLIDELESAAFNTEPTFHAILACPLCGELVLVSTAQYFGFAPVICGARACSGFFKIVDGQRLVYLAVN